MFDPLADAFGVPDVLVALGVAVAVSLGVGLGLCDGVGVLVGGLVVGALVGFCVLVAVGLGEVVAVGGSAGVFEGLGVGLAVAVGDEVSVGVGVGVGVGLEVAPCTGSHPWLLPDTTAANCACAVPEVPGSAVWPPLSAAVTTPKLVAETTRKPPAARLTAGRTCAKRMKALPLLSVARFQYGVPTSDRVLPGFAVSHSI
jgi:hypothetical protein